MTMSGGFGPGFGLSPSRSPAPQRSRSASVAVISLLAATVSVLACLHYIAPLLSCDGPIATYALVAVVVTTCPPLAMPLMAFARRMAR